MNPTVGADAGPIVLIGGYGAVGTEVGRTLAPWFPGRVLPAGRDLDRARRGAAELGGAFGGARVDVTEPGSVVRLLTEYRPAAVVLCVEPPDAEIARLCLSGGVPIVDVGASHHLLAATAALRDTAASTGARALLSVGVAPGLSNLPARRAHTEVGGADRIEITIVLGAGERHGTDAIRWTLDGLAAPVTATPARVGLPGCGVRTATRSRSPISTRCATRSAYPT
ncbi:saccharopine dehydrogenase NADP-binding domain-containing protein (plasmid) [Embleya sp. NBC_00888]|uniref:saccharopine dehydrogenase NADP-binding domain-containing protein n=1 Tax=Embleya sp. NBC_00888 TaxID=2975960 RepID=UPI002F91462A|nr:saccharopine dehydrogenase NADP-binding domain-containing protein [Embleya sp. NBC_00888]